MPTLSGFDAVLAQSAVLVSWWKPLVLLAPFVGWAWFVSRIFDKHAARFSLPRKQWNMIHLLVGTAALLGAFALPVPGIGGVLAALGLLLVVFAADILIFINLHNKDERTQPGHELRLDLSALQEAKTKKAASKQAGTVKLKIVSVDKSTVAVPDGETPEFEIRVKAEDQLIAAVDGRARLFEFAPIDKEGNYAVTMTVDGAKQAIEKLPGAAAIKLIDFWKAAGKLDLQDRRRRQQQTITVSLGDVWHKSVRLTTQGGQSGPRLVMLFEPAKQVQRKLEDLGLLDQQVESLKTIITDPGGLVLVAAQAGQGLTSTLYTITGQHDPYTKIVQTVETDLQAPLEGANQNRFDPNGQGEYSTMVRSILRRDPDFVTVMELPDKETAVEIVRADLQRSRVYAGVRTEGALQALQGFVKLHGDAKAVGGVLKGAIAQRLVRKLCTNCRVSYQPKPDMLQKLGLPADRVKQLFKKGGQVLIKNKPEVCPVCGGAGYIGQIALFEVFPLGEAERALIVSQDWNGLRAELRKRQLPTLQQVGLRRAVEGVTSLEEITRSAAPAQPAPAGASQPAPTKAGSAPRA